MKGKQSNQGRLEHKKKKLNVFHIWWCDFKSHQIRKDFFREKNVQCTLEKTHSRSVGWGFTRGASRRLQKKRMLARDGVDSGFREGFWVGLGGRD